MALLVVLAVGSSQVLAARADIAADAGRGPVVPVAAATRVVAPPVVLGIPRIKVTSRLAGLRKASNGTLQVPEDAQRAGWYSQGAAPGDPGPAVIVGHVDSYRGPGVFARLDTLRRGDPIRIRRADGSLVTFFVTQVRDYAKREFPTALVYGGGKTPSLRLITCGGAFDRRSRHYLSNTIVFADLQRPGKPKAPAGKLKAPAGKPNAPAGKPVPAPRRTPGRA